MVDAGIPRILSPTVHANCVFFICDLVSARNTAFCSVGAMRKVEKVVHVFSREKEKKKSLLDLFSFSWRDGMESKVSEVTEIESEQPS